MGDVAERAAGLPLRCPISREKALFEARLPAGATSPLTFWLSARLRDPRCTKAGAHVVRTRNQKPPRPEHGDPR